MSKLLSIFASASLLGLMFFSLEAKSEESMSQLDREKRQFQELIRWKQPLNPTKLSIVEAMTKAETIPKVISYAYAIDSSLAVTLAMLAREILLPPRCASVGMAAIAASADP